MPQLFYITILLWTLEYSRCNSCPTTDTAFGWIGSSPVFNYTYNTNVEGLVELRNTSNIRLFFVAYFDKTVISGPEFNGCILAPGGNISAGLLNIQLNPLQAGQQGTYRYIGDMNAVLKCITLYIHGPPTLPTIGSNAEVVYEGQSAVLTCSSTSTTVPNGHGLLMNYEWRRDDVTVSTGGRFTLESTAGRTLTISNINRDDRLHSFSCRATEQSGNTSVLSSAFRLTVGYGPDSVTLTPSDASYTLNETQPMNDITCSATCYPACSFTWTKSGGGTVGTTNGVLSLGTLERSEAGIYWCTAMNAARSVNSSSVTINVNYGPNAVTLSPPTASYTLNETQLMNDITCSAACYPSCAYTWTKSGGSTVSTTGGVLSLGTLNRSEAGTYWCTAKNAAGSFNSLSVNIDVVYGPASVTLSPSTTSYTINENESMNDITCSASCFPACTYTWTKSGGATISTTDLLSLGTLQRAKAGSYYCTARNQQTTAFVNSQTVIVVVRYGPDSVILTPPRTSYTLNENQPMNEITCSATCYPDQCTYQWIKSGVGEVSNTGVLSLGTVQRGEAGNYMCTARNPGSAVTASSQQIGVLVRYGPDSVTLSIPSEYTVIEGQIVSNVTCSSNCWPACTYTWRNLTSGTLVSTTGLLIIGQVNRYAAGSYVCVANNSGSGHTDSSSTKLVVKFAPDVNINTSSTNLTEGQPLELTCGASGVPATYTFTAFTQTHGGTQIPNTHITLEGLPSMSIVRIPALRMDDTGTYTCSVENGVPNVNGHLQQTSTKKLIVKVSPKVLTTTLKVAAATGANASLSIPVYAYPGVEEIVLQRYDGLNINSTSEKHILLWYNTTVSANWYETKVQVDGTLLNFTIINLQPVDFGNYTLIMKNVVNVSSSVLTVVAESKPSSPEALNFTVIQKSVNFAWKRGFNGGHPQTFIVQLSKDSADNYINHTTISEETNIDANEMVTVKISNLDVGDYHARLLTFNKIGNAEPEVFGVFTIAQESDNIPPVSAALIGGVVGGGAAVILVAVILFILWKKRRLTGSKSDVDRLTHGQKLDKLNNRKKIKKAEVDDTGDVEVENMMYIPASDISRGASPSDVVYTTVNKAKPTEASPDVYAVVDKKAIKKNKKGKKNASMDDVDIYENSAPSQRMKAQDNKGFVRENHSPKLPKKTLNHDGLEYAELEFVNPPKGQKRLVIHGLDNMTEYAEVDLTKKADPLPDSDTEDKNKKE